MALINNKNRIEISQNKVLKEVLKVMIHRAAKDYLEGQSTVPSTIDVQKRYNFASQVLGSGISDNSVAQYILTVFEGQSAIPDAVGGNPFNVQTFAAWALTAADTDTTMQAFQAAVNNALDQAAGVLPGDGTIAVV